MLSRIVVLLGVASLMAAAMWYLGESRDEAAAKQEVENRMNALREHLLRR